MKNKRIISSLRFLKSSAEIILWIILPFLLLVRGAVFIHTQYGTWSYFSVIGSVMLTSFMLSFYIYFLKKKYLKDFKKMPDFTTRFRYSFTGVIFFSIYSIFFLTGNYCKSPALKREIRKVHPVIRLAVSVIVLADSDLIITDATRKPSDYREMGLPVKEKSLHYIQNDGYAYAIDIRTQQRSFWRNTLIQWYFRSMGFTVLRHGGTGDHLHVSLYCHQHPYSR